jgi:hypothetical protein
MWLKKKFLLIALLVVVVLGGTLGGIAIAQANDQGTGQSDNTSQFTTLLDKVVSHYLQDTGVTINAQDLAKAFTEAQQDIRSGALDNYLNNLVTNGKITQDQANQFKNWLNTKPDIPGLPGFGGGFRGMERMGRMFGHWGAPDTNSGSSN